MLRSPKHLIPLILVLFWVIMMGLLVYREAIVPRLYHGGTWKRVDMPEDIWLGLYFGEEHLAGSVHLQTTPSRREDEEGSALRASVHLDLPLFGKNTRFALTGKAWQSALHGLREFDFTLRAEEHDMRLVGVVESGTIKVVMHTAGEEMPFTLPVGNKLLLSGGLGLSSATLPSLQPGEVVYLDSFDPATMSLGKAKLEALRKETLTVSGHPVETTLIETTISGIVTRAWISADEEIIRAETPLGLIIKKISPEDLFKEGDHDDPAVLRDTLTIRPRGLSIPDDVERLTLRISGLTEQLTLPEDSRQYKEGDCWIFERQGGEMMAGQEALSPSETEEYLAPDLFIQSNHPRIKEAAQAIAGDTEDPWIAAVRLHDWMYEHIEKEHILSVPSALEVLDQRRGDCNEHAVLYTALARALDIPARIAIGLAWSDDLKAFGYHAWPEVYAGQWMALDPTFGERNASPTHVKFFTGGIDQWARLVAFVGRIEIEVVAVE
ncbi:MAG: transglutaminase domain-containing protein [Candidatus Hydrogenedens sp.]|nr:transglutaminase domain-containing protein [Candidatus Hydrogenedens sp.]